MSLGLRSKKVSAFAVFRGRKAASMTDVNEASDVDTSSKKGKKKAASTSTTPTASRETSLSSLVAKLTPSDKKKQKADMKKLKKMLKSSSKQRPSFLPDSAVQSPLAELSASNVTLKSLRPKGSMVNMNYSLPLRGNFVPKNETPETTPMRQSVHVDGTPTVSQGQNAAEITPPVPPRNSNLRASTRSMQNNVAVSGRINTRFSQNDALSQRTSTKSLPSEAVPPLPPRQVNKRASVRSTASVVSGVLPLVPPRFNRGHQRTSSDDTDNAPTRPPKRRKMSQSSPSGNQEPGLSRRTSLGDVHGAERTEPLPTHPSDVDNGLPYMHDSLHEATKLFECLIHPVKPQKFFSELWEKKPLLVKRHMPSYNDGWFSTAELDRILRDHRVMFTENLDVTSYENGKRETHNPIGRAFAPVVWDYYQNGCSVRMLNPQTYSRNVWKLLSILQEYFGSCVGANTYLTPPGTQGFAPHYDDIEAFILQLEGKKHWRLYSPRSEGEALPRYSSGNFSPDDIGEPILDVILEAGDLLYFPRGTIHQGRTLEDAHSMHITVSCCQKNTWADFFEKLVPTALEVASQEDVEFRKALPKDYLNYMGVAFSDSESPERKAFLRKVEQLMMKLLSHAPVDGAADQLGKRFIHDTLPPVFTEAEKQKSIHGSGEHWSVKDQRVRGAVEIEPDTPIKLIRKGVVRLVSENEKVCIYHNLENTRIYHQVDPQFIEISAEMAPAVEYLLHSYPEYVTVDSFPMENVEEKVSLAAAMYEKGMLMAEQPLEPLSEGSSEGEG